MKMDSLKSNKLVLRWLCVCPAVENTSIWRKLAHIAFTLLNILCIFTSVWASVNFFLKYVSSNLELALNAIWQIGALSSLLYFLAVAYLTRQKFMRMFETLDQIYDQSMDFSQIFPLKSFFYSLFYGTFQWNG